MASGAKKSRLIERIYRQQWEKEPWAEGWLTSIGNAPTAYQSPNGAWCKLCRINLAPHKKDLKRHSETEKHKGKIKTPTQNTLTNYGYVDAVATQKSKILDIKLAVFIAKHAAVTAIDHLSELLKSIDQNKVLFENLKLHRTKCSGIIKYVVTPCILKDLVEAVGNSKFSLIVDESTDISQTQWICFFQQFAQPTVSTYSHINSGQ
ncbi:PREDICTED: uncharacterized protein LOC108372741 [Rhagoletis zephyria]|uniref:uncharacterized protein LOC108372741 n=1 Tax=Rhagoletis zephyria TaxID=28612 RepID=UPI000811369C|nr:PREDICTED: uncharacterized protein LOC108372741 [Rhagoletis zephyria]